MRHISICYLSLKNKTTTIIILVNICSKKRQLIKKITQPAANLLLTVAMVRRNLLAFSSDSGGLAGLKRGNMKNY
ncbi:hypothetical protein T03_4888 [Trichinella britovi]|uniref:Uncharacterized protein n=1 Tax=Trichinella britovi TaxID=45882 RepID=A0A0V1CEY1_TRIBR|nr:hypothetical protein T03_4888 [Trichinella britovi]